MLMLLVKLLGLIQTSPEQRAAPAQAGELWQGKPHVTRNTGTIFKIFFVVCESLFSLKVQVAVNFRYFFS